MNTDFRDSEVATKITIKSDRYIRLRQRSAKHTGDNKWYRVFYLEFFNGSIKLESLVVTSWGGFGKIGRCKVEGGVIQDYEAAIRKKARITKGERYVFQIETDDHEVPSYEPGYILKLLDLTLCSGSQGVIDKVRDFLHPVSSEIFREVETKTVAVDFKEIGGSQVYGQEWGAFE